MACTSVPRDRGYGEPLGDNGAESVTPEIWMRTKRGM